MLALISYFGLISRSPQTFPLKAGEARVNQIDGAVMVWIPVGPFIMGMTAEEGRTLTKLHRADVTDFRFDRETPLHKVYLDGYWMYKTVVTAGQYRAFCNATGRKMPVAPRIIFPGGPEPKPREWRDLEPMTEVNWFDAKDYCKWARADLPTEAQWEKAARGTDGRAYPWGNRVPNPQFARSRCMVGNLKLQYTWSVLMNPQWASPYGVEDLVGMPYQWCLDWYDNDYYKRSPTRNPTGPKAGPLVNWGLGHPTALRVTRGRDTWNRIFWEPFRCANRGMAAPEYRSDNQGFRCVVNP